MSFAYPPSKTPVAELSPISIDDLRLETHHIGRVLFVRAFGTPRRLVGLHTGIEDKNGDVDRLAVYNLPPNVPAEHVIPQHCVLAIKEPYYKATADRGYTIRVDHPSDLLCLPSDSLLVPLELSSALADTRVAPISCKDKGNAYYRAKDYFNALELYSLGLKSCSAEDRLLRADIYRNRSVTNLLVGRYEDAVSDATASMLQADQDIDQEKVAMYNTKALFRAGRAHYELGQFEESHRAFAVAMQITPEDHDTLMELSRVKARMAEIATGEYNFGAMRSALKHGRLRLDHASYTHNVTVRSAGSKGRGLFATKRLRAGDVVMCEKAFQSCFRGDSSNDIYIVININTNSGNTGPHASLLFRIIDHLRYNPGHARQFVELWDGGYKPKYGAVQVDGQTVVDTFETQAIIEHNCFSSEIDPRIAEDTSSDKPSGVLAIWTTASLSNHSCIGNACRAILGDMMIISAVRDIEEDEEITMSYRSWEANLTERQSALNKTWGFTCQCVLCTAEREAPTGTRLERQALDDLMTSLLRAHQHSEDYQQDKRTIQEVEQLYHQLVNKYDMTVFRHLPRHTLIAPNHWLTQAYATSSYAQRCKSHAMDLLQNLGFGVEVHRTGLNVDRTNAHMDVRAVDAAIHLRNVHLVQKDRVMADAFERFARECWRILHADEHGFVERYNT